jgi:hypothetical protein
MTAPFDLFGYRKRDGNAEARIQHAIVEYVRLVAPGIPDLAIVAPGGRVCFRVCPLILRLSKIGQKPLRTAPSKESSQRLRPSPRVRAKMIRISFGLSSQDHTLVLEHSYFRLRFFLRRARALERFFQ